MKLLRTNFKGAILTRDKENKSWRKDAAPETREHTLSILQREIHRLKVLDYDIDSILTNKYFDAVKDDIKEIQKVRKAGQNSKHKNGNIKSTYFKDNHIETKYLSGNTKCIYKNGKLTKYSDHDLYNTFTLFEIPLNDQFRYDGIVTIICNHPIPNAEGIQHHITVKYVNGKQDGPFNLGISTRRNANITPVISIDDMKNWKAYGVVRIMPVSEKLASSTEASYISDSNIKMTYGNNKLRKVKLQSDETEAELLIELTDLGARVIFKDCLGETIIFEDGSAQNLTLWTVIPFSKGQKIKPDQEPLTNDTMLIIQELLFDFDAQKQTIKLSEQSKNNSYIKAVDQELMADYL